MSEEYKSPLLYEQMSRGEIPIESESDRKIINNLKESDKEIFEQYPVDDFVNSVHFGIKKQRFSLISRGVKAVLPLCAILVLTVTGLPLFDNVRLKGGSSGISAYVQREEYAEVLKPEDLAGKGDVIQLSYFVDKWDYGVIMSLDGNNHITLHYPEYYNSDTTLEKSREIMLPYSHELDNAPEFEHYYFVVSDRPIDISALEEILKTGEFNMLKKNSLKIIDEIYLEKR